MRLLWRVEDDIFALTSFEGKQLPPYAVLSHTWIEGQEVTYDDIMVGAGKDKSDFGKLRFCSNQAAADGIQYFWIDTCCTDKSSSRSINTTINSRFLWFRHAARCYVYLADVSVPGTADPRFFQSRWAEAFRQSEWFKQAWTLQDLLAREDIEFFSKEGKLLGNKTALLREIHGITQIPINALKGQSLAWYSVDDKISWAASRKVMHEEDRVYCLAGILGVFLPAKYGEGKDWAMHRLKEAVQIFQKPQQEKRFMGSHRREAHSVRLIPFPRNPNFINPGKLLDEIEERCSVPASRVAIVGTAGMGKSELVLEHCYRAIERSPTTCIFWITANDAEKIKQDYRDIARRMNIEGCQEPGADVLKLVHDWMCASKIPWVLVLDNLEVAIPRIMRYILPSCKHGSTLITTRNRNTARKLVAWRDIVVIRKINDEHASTLLDTRLEADKSIWEDDITFSHLLQNSMQTMESLEDLEKDRDTITVADSKKKAQEFKTPNQHLPVTEQLQDADSDCDIQQDDDKMSIQSIQSSTTLNSTFSNSTIVAKSATVELEKVFQEDEELISLYRLALKDTSMEPDKLQRNVARLLQFFAKDLRREARGQLEKIASRFVQSKAQYIAQCIVEQFNDTPRVLQQQLGPNNEAVEEQNETQMGMVEVTQGQSQVNEPLTMDDVDEVAPVDEDYFEDLAVLREFLVCSSAFQLFRARLNKFVLPKGLWGSGIDCIVKDHPVETPLSRMRRLLFSTSRIFKAILVIAGCLEPPLEPGFIRLRWQCECGDSLFGDIQEYRIGGTSRLMERMEKSTGGKVTATSYNKESTNQQYILGPIIWVRETTRNMMRSFMRAEKCSDTLPRHSRPSITVTPASPDIESPLPRDLLLLACMNESQGGQFLHQDSIGAMSNDRQLFCFIREQISQAPRKHWPSRFLKSVSGIHFTQFHLRLNDDVEPRLHKLCCRQDACQCVPLTSNTEYDCQPAGPLDFGPPVLPSKMLHYFQHPELISEKEMSIFNQLPKRNCGKLHSTGLVPAEGWGLYYEEKWNSGLLIAIFVLMVVSASLVFGIWWTVEKSDIQGAWGVSSYMITTCALVVGLVSIAGRASGG